MKHMISTGIGMLASAALSTLLAYGTAVTAGASRHPLEAWPWIFGASGVPCAIGCLALSLLVSSTQGNRLLLHFAALGVAFLVTAVAASVGAVTVEVLRRGFESVNVEGYLIWCWVYAAAFLPVTYPLVFGLQHIIHRIHKRQV